MASKRGQRDAVLEYLLQRQLAGEEGVRPVDLAEELGLPAPSVRRVLRQLRLDGSVAPYGGTRQAPEYFIVPVDPQLVPSETPVTAGESLRPPVYDVGDEPGDGQMEWGDWDDEWADTGDGETGDDSPPDSGVITLAAW